MLSDSQSVHTDFALFSFVSWKHHGYKQPNLTIDSPIFAFDSDL